MRVARCRIGQRPHHQVVAVDLRARGQVVVQCGAHQHPGRARRALQLIGYTPAPGGQRQPGSLRRRRPQRRGLLIPVSGSRYSVGGCWGGCGIIGTHQRRHQHRSPALRRVHRALAIVATCTTESLRSDHIWFSEAEVMSSGEKY